MVVTPAVAPTPSRTSNRLVQILIAVLVVAGSVSLFAGASSLLAEPHRTTVVLENPTDYSVNVHVRPVDGGGRLGLGEINPTSLREIHSVTHQGDRWLFEFSWAGVDAGALEVSGEAVEDGEIEIPASVAEVLRDAGLAPPPR